MSLSRSRICRRCPIPHSWARRGTATGRTCWPRRRRRATIDGVERLGMRDDTIGIFTSDNGPEFVKPWDGWAGPWRGQYFTAWEGGIRAPFMIRWPGKIPAARLSDEIVHGVNLFPTLASFVGATVPDDRP